MVEALHNPTNPELERSRTFMQLLSICDEITTADQVIDIMGNGDEYVVSAHLIEIPQEGVKLGIQLFNEDDASLINERIEPPHSDDFILGIIDFTKEKDGALMEGTIYLLESQDLMHETDINLSDEMDEGEFAAFAKNMGLSRSWKRRLTETPLNEDPVEEAQQQYEDSLFRMEDQQRLLGYLQKFHQELREVQQT